MLSFMVYLELLPLLAFYRGVLVSSVVFGGGGGRCLWGGGEKNNRVVNE